MYCRTHISHTHKKQYNQAKTALFQLYDKAIMSMLKGTEFSAEDSELMKKILRGIIEPSILPIYEKIDVKFFNSYLKSHGENH